MGKVVKKIGGVAKKAVKAVAPVAGAIGGAFGPVGAAVGGLADAYGTYQSGKDAKNAAQDAVGIADPFAPYRGQYAQSLSSLYANPSQITALPAYQFRLNQGLDAINRNAAAKGYLGSGNRLMELMRYGQDYGSQEFDREIARLSGLSGATTGSPAAAGQLQAQYAGTIQDTYRNTAGAFGSAAEKIGDAVGGLFGQKTPSLSNSYQQPYQQPSYQQPYNYFTFTG